MSRFVNGWSAVGLLVALAGCSGETSTLTVQSASSCMLCHNGSLGEDYSGPGIENPHPFPGASNLSCTDCHGGDPNGTDMLSSHVPPPPQIGDRAFQEQNALAYFNRLTLTGMDKFPNYVVNGRTYTALEYLQFVNPGDLRVVEHGRSCGACHAGHSELVSKSLLATSAGIFSGATFAAGIESAVPESQGLHQDTASDTGFRAVNDTGFAGNQNLVGAVARLLEYPVFSKRNVTGPQHIFQNPAYDAAGLSDDRDSENRAIAGSPLANLYMEQVAFTCGNCHLGSAGANDRAGDFRSSGCTSCHMPYSLDGRSRSTDPNVNKTEPLDPDDIDEPERPHARSHRIHGVARTLSNGAVVPGIDDYACAGCHQGSNRTVMQYWGIRLDQNADVRNNRQYPANPITNQTTNNDPRLFDPVAQNNTFNGRNANQYLLREDYDGDGRDDTPEDVHYQAGMGCIDCHGSWDLHGGNPADPDSLIRSRMEQQTAISCESCHGTIDAYAPVAAGTTYDGVAADVASDTRGNKLRHVWRGGDGLYYLKSRLTGNTHVVPQTRDVVVNTGRAHPGTAAPFYSAKASYAMGRIDGTNSNGIGPKQTSGAHQGFSHTDNMDCASCHSAWTNTCMGCHLSGQYDNGNNFSNVTGERIVFKERTADFTYQSPLFFQLGVDPSGKITQFSSNTKVFFQWRDRNGQFSQRFSFSDRRGVGNAPDAPSGFPSMSHNAIMAHSIRGKVDATREGPRYCASCHLTSSGLQQYEAQYDSFRAAMEAGDWGALDFTLMRQHFGRNTGNHMESPLFVHGVAGLGTGLFLFDVNGAPVNPLDTFAGRKGADGVAPASVFNPANVFFNLDRIVEPDGRANGSSNHAWLNGVDGSHLRDGAADPTMAGPLGARLIRLLCDPEQGLVLDSWLDTQAAPQGGAGGFLGGG
ncbi:MAG: hypothetical protein JNK02_16865 [Planctomycetes bacterium]|nr:hypothetical protein [Planctomycetota bacterium]